MFKKINFQFLISYFGLIPYLLTFLDKYYFLIVEEERLLSFITYYSLIIIVFIGSINWNLKNNIPAAVDKFIGYCATSDLSDETKLKMKVSKKIGLHYQKIPSDIMHEGDVGHWQFTEQEVNEFMKSDKFEWWKK